MYMQIINFNLGIDLLWAQVFLHQISSFPPTFHWDSLLGNAFLTYFEHTRVLENIETTVYVKIFC